MIKFRREKVLQLHRMMADTTGGSIGVREDSLMESALELPFSGFGDQEFYPTMEEKAARLGYSLIANHAFVDGNKRIGIFVMLVFLSVNGVELHLTNEDVIQAGLGVADGSLAYEDLLRWVQEHRV